MDGSNSPWSPEEIAEIERHKYFLSEKAGHDVGWDAAEQDWQKRFKIHRLDPSSQARPAAGLGSWLKRLLSKAGVL